MTFWESHLPLLDCCLLISLKLKTSLAAHGASVVLQLLELHEVQKKEEASQRKALIYFGQTIDAFFNKMSN